MSISKKRVLFIAPSIQQGGLENAVAIIANWFFENGFDVKIATIYKFPIFYNISPSIEVLKPSYARDDHNSVVFYLKTIAYLRKKIKDSKPHVIVSYGDYLNPLSIISNFGNDVPIYISDRASPGLSFPSLVRLIRKYTYSKATGIIAQTERAKKQKIQMLNGFDNVEVVPNPIRPIQTYQEEKKKVVLGVGRHYKVKGLDRLIQAFGTVRNEDWELHIAGNTGPETENLKVMARKHVKGDRVKFLGAVKDIDRVFSYSSLFVLPSRSEGFPNALIEAMAHGLPCISFDINAGPAEIIEHEKSGLLIPDGQVNELAKAIQCLIMNPSKRNDLGAEALKLKEELHLDKIGEKYLNFITNY